MVERVTLTDAGCDPLSIVHDRHLVRLELGDGDNIKTFTWDCGDPDHWRAFIRFREALGRLADAASLTGYEDRHPDGDEDDDER